MTAVAVIRILTRYSILRWYGQNITWFAVFGIES